MIANGDRSISFLFLSQGKMLRGENIVTGGMAEERVGAPDTTIPRGKTSIWEKAPGPEAPPVRKRRMQRYTQEQ